MNISPISDKILQKRRIECERWIKNNIQEPSIQAFLQSYWQNPIVLYTGAGISTGPKMPIQGRQYGLPTWHNLLKEVAGQSSSSNWPKDPWEAADMAVQLCKGRKKFDIKLKKLIQQSHNYRSKGQLNGTFLRNAQSLNAVAAFCGQITGQITNPKIDNPQITSFRVTKNPRIHAILTANYDCFLECAASNLYRKSPLKPVTAIGSLAASRNRIPVFHIHGFVPHPKYHQENRQQTINKLIITQKDYEKHWKQDNVFGTTMGPQIHYLRYFTVLFIGFSFTDKYVCKLLRRITKDYLSSVGRTHFALLKKQEVQKHPESFFKNIGIMPIIYKKHDDIPSILGEIYTTGLIADRIAAGEKSIMHFELPGLLVKKHTLTGEVFQYNVDKIWEMMRRLNNESVNTSLLN